MALPVAVALSGVDTEIRRKLEYLYHSLNGHRLNDSLSNCCQQPGRCTCSNQREEYKNRQSRPTKENEKKYWDLINQIDNITLEEPNPRTLGQLKVNKVLSSPSTSNSTFQSTNRFGFPNERASNYIRLPTGPITGRMYPQISSMELSSSSELMNFTFTHMPPTSTPWSTRQPAVSDRTNNSTHMQYIPWIDAQTPSSSNTSLQSNNSRRSRPASNTPFNLTRDESFHTTLRTPSSTLDLISPKNVLSEVAITPPRSSRMANSRLHNLQNSYKEPVINYQNRDLLDLGANIQQSTYQVNPKVILKPTGPENRYAPSAVGKVVMCTEDDCRFIFVDYDK